MEDLPLESLKSMFDIWSLVAGLVFGVIGYWIYKRGRKETNFRNVVVGLALMIYPYFIQGTKLTWGIGLALCGYAYSYWNSDSWL